MDLKEFAIGETFWTGGGQFRCTDIGTRVVVAIKLGPQEICQSELVEGVMQMITRIDDDPSWLDGPPYAIAEHVFDEYDQEGCVRTEAEL